MATTAAPFTDLSTSPDFAKGAQLFTWTSVPNGNQGASVHAIDYTDRTVQVTGTFGVGGSVQLEGSLDNTNWFILRDPLGANLTFTAAGLKQILENPRFIRPNVTAGDGTTALTVNVVVSSTARG